MTTTDTSSRATTSLDISDVLDAGAWTSFQKLVVGLAALSVILDGFDSQLIGYAIPSIMKDWGLPRGAFTGVVAAGLIGMSIGSASAGLVADRFGRRARSSGPCCCSGSRRP